MAMRWQKGVLFAAGLLLGCGLGAWAVVGPLHAVHGPVPSPADAGAAAEPVAAVEATAGPPRCDLGPVVAKAGAGDGQQALQSHPAGASASEVAAQLLAGKEAAASGRVRDAEVTFLNACHSAQVVPGHDVALVADADYQLARLYANLAITGGPRAAELRRRAEQLYGASLATYRTRYGESHEKTRFATEGLARLEKKFESGGTTEVAEAGAKPDAAAATHVNAPTTRAPLPRPRETAAAIPLAQRTQRAARHGGDDRSAAQAVQREPQRRAAAQPGVAGEDEEVVIVRPRPRIEADTDTGTDTPPDDAEAPPRTGIDAAPLSRRSAAAPAAGR